jgi:hypothetical protein
MAKPLTSDAIMPADKMKPLLAMSKREPVSAAIGLTTDGEAVMLLHKMAKPKKVMSMMKAEAAKAKIQLSASTLRFGRAEVDPEYDSSMVRFFVNKEAPGVMRPKLVEIVKRMAFGKVEFNVDAALEDEPEDEQEQQAQEQPPPAPPAPPDMTDLKTELGGLIPKLVAASGGDAARLDKLKALAGTANNAIKGSNASEAAAAIAELQKAMGAPQSAPAGANGGAVPPAPSPPPEAPAAPQAAKGNAEAAKGNFVKMQQSRLIWVATRKKIAGEIAALKKEALDFFADDPEETKVVDALDQLDEILGQLDEGLVDTLDDLLQETDPAKHAELLAAAKEEIDRYTNYTKSSPLVQGLEGDTPFGTKLSISSTLNSTLKALQASLH